VSSIPLKNRVLTIVHPPLSISDKRESVLNLDVDPLVSASPNQIRLLARSDTTG
jgi:hypothetical protein